MNLMPRNPFLDPMQARVNRIRRLYYGVCTTWSSLENALTRTPGEITLFFSVSESRTEKRGYCSYRNPHLRSWLP